MAGSDSSMSCRENREKSSIIRIGSGANLFCLDRSMNVAKSPFNRFFPRKADTPRSANDCLDNCQPYWRQISAGLASWRSAPVPCRWRADDNRTYEYAVFMRKQRSTVALVTQARGSADFRYYPPVHRLRRCLRDWPRCHWPRTVLRSIATSVNRGGYRLIRMKSPAAMKGGIGPGALGHACPRPLSAFDK